MNDGITQKGLAVEDTYYVRIDAIHKLPPGRQKTILSRKALAVFMGLARTDSLRTYDAFDAETAYRIIAKHVAQGPGYGAPSGHEPRDDSDKSKSPHSLEAFSRAQPPRER